VFCYLLVAASAAHAQFEPGSIVGIVRDQQQAPAPDASVEIRNLNTNTALKLYF